VKKIVIDEDKVKLYFNLPLPPQGRKMETLGVLPIDTTSGAEVSIGRTFKIVFSISEN
jgi:hypothetical protein